MTQTERETLRIITGWLNDLSRLVRHGEAKPTKDQIAVYATVLAKDFPSGAFNIDSLQFAAQDMTWWPEYAALRPLLASWWRDHKPAAAPLLRYEGQDQLSRVDQSWLEFYHKKSSAAQTPAERERLDSLLRQESPAAWKLIEGEKPQRAPPTEAYLAELRHTIAATVAPLTPPAPPRASTLSTEQLAETRNRLALAAARNVR